MQNNLEVFDEYLSRLELAIEQNRLSNCYAMCSRLTRYSTMSGYQDGVLISEILESIFLQLRDLFDTTNIPETEQKEVLTELKTHVASIRATYKDDDKNSIYNTLKEIRNLTTGFQFHCWDTFSAKPTSLRSRMEQF